MTWPKVLEVSVSIFNQFSWQSISVPFSSPYRFSSFKSILGSTKIATLDTVKRTLKRKRWTSGRTKALHLPSVSRLLPQQLRMLKQFKLEQTDVISSLVFRQDSHHSNMTWKHQQVNSVVLDVILIRMNWPWVTEKF